MEYGYKIKNCRMCESEKLYEFLDLGFHPPSDKILSKEDLLGPEVHFPLKVLQCENCGLTQLSYAVNPDLLYGYQYKYESSMTQTGRDHFFSMANSIISKFNLENNSLIVDIGSNVGILLESFKEKGMNVLGIDPAPEIVEIANKRGIETWKSLMNSLIAEKIIAEKGKAKIITGTNVFAHIHDKDELMKAVNICLDEKGIFIVEAPYLVDLIENLEYDTIYLEHLEYLSVKPLVKFFEKHDMDLFDVERYNIHGRSIRFFVCRKGGKPISKNVERLIELEDIKGIYRKEILDDFRERVQKHAIVLINLLRDLKKEGKKIIGISAPAKGNTILNYCKIGPDLIDCITEKSVIKREHYTPGMHIPIIGEDEFLGKADYGIILAWNFANEIIKNNKRFSDKGGNFIIPIGKMGIEIKRYIN